MKFSGQTIMTVCMFAAAGLGLTGVATAQTAKPPPPNPIAKPMEITGQHRGFTNEKLFLQLEDGKELTFVVDIPGDRDRKWQKDFAADSKITVTYIPGAPGGPLIAKSLKKAVEGGKK